MTFEKFISGFKVIEPLSNFQIIEKCEELKIKNFTGVFMRDELNNKKANKNECMILNIDHSKNEGTHWTSLFIKNNIGYYFDSYGFPPTEEVKKYCKNLIYSSSFKIQDYNEIICGHYSIYILYKLSKQHKLDEKIFHDICMDLKIEKLKNLKT